MKISLTSRILIAFFLVALGGFYLLLDKLLVRVERQYMEALEEPMVDTAHLLAAMVEQRIDETGTLQLEPVKAAFENGLSREFRAQVYELLKTEVGMHVYVTDARGIVLFDSDDGKAEGQDYSRFNDVVRTLDGRYGARSTRLDEENEDSSVMHVAAPIYWKETIAGVLTVRKPQASMFQFIGETKRQMVWLVLAVLASILLSTWLVVRWLSRPIKRLTSYARSVEQGERVALPPLGRSEVATLGNAFEEMRDALEGRKYAETYVQTLTHEMKSPVAAIRGAAELLSGDSEMPPEKRTRFLGNIADETKRLQNIIERLLALSVIEGRKTLENREPVDLGRLVEEVCDSHESSRAAKGLTFAQSLENEVVVEGERFILEMAVANLLQNAIEFSPRGGTVIVQLKREGRIAELRLEDDGPGIPDYAIDRVFDRFYSLQHPDTGKKSSGLGLCFVREAAELHGGRAQLRNGENGGAIASLRIPITS